MKNKRTDLSLLTILLSSFAIGGSTYGINAILQKLTEVYSNIPVSTVYLAATIASLASLIATLLLGPFVGRKIGFKPIMTAGLFCYLVGGIAPAVIHDSFYFILACRALFGVGAGCLAFRNTMLMNSYSDNERPKYLGLSTLFMNIGGVAIQLASGILGDIKYYLAFWVYIVALAPFIMSIFFLNEPHESEKQNIAAVRCEEKGKINIKPAAFVYMLMFCIASMHCNQIALNNSALVNYKGLGNAAVSGLILSMYTAGGAISGALFDKLYKFTKKYIVTFLSATLLLGSVIVLIASQVASMMIGILLCGFVGNVLTPMIFQFVSMLTKPDSMSLATSLISTSGYLGNFLANYWIVVNASIFGSSMSGPLYGCMIFAAICALIFSIKDPRPLID